MLNSCCAQYYIIPNDSEENIELLESSECSGCVCHCGYIQYESLAPYMPKLTNNYTKDDDHVLLEARLRQQIIEISRLFDAETKVEDGTYSKAHYKILDLYGNGTNYLPVPDFVKGSLKLYTKEGYLINSDSYAYKDGFLVLNPCNSHSSNCGCVASCGAYQNQNQNQNIGWGGCFKVKAKFGKECADQAVQMAVRDFLIEHNTFADEKEAKFAGLVPRPFRVPYSWSKLVEKYLQTKRLNSYFSFA